MIYLILGLISYNMVKNFKIIFISALLLSINIPFSTFALENNIRNKVKVAYLTFDADMTPYMKKKLEDAKVSAWV